MKKVLWMAGLKCQDEKHSVGINSKGQLVFSHHTKQSIANEVALADLGAADVYPCALAAFAIKRNKSLSCLNEYVGRPSRPLELLEAFARLKRAYRPKAGADASENMACAVLFSMFIYQCKTAQEINLRELTSHVGRINQHGIRGRALSEGLTQEMWRLINGAKPG